MRNDGNTKKGRKFKHRSVKKESTNYPRDLLGFTRDEKFAHEDAQSGDKILTLEIEEGGEGAQQARVMLVLATQKLACGEGRRSNEANDEQEQQRNIYADATKRKTKIIERKRGPRAACKRSGKRPARRFDER